MIIISVSYVIWEIPTYLQKPSVEIPDSSEKLIQIQNEYRKTIIQLIAGFVILFGLYLTFRRIRALEENVKIAGENLKISQNNLEENIKISQKNILSIIDGQITERFTKAIEQLGNEKIEVRLGGICALERIARDSENDYWTVMEVLTAYVREHTTIKERIYQSDEELKNKKEEKQAEGQTELELATTDIQAILTVIKRRKWFDREGEKGWYFNLCNTNLSKADLQGANFQKINFQQANLEKANFNDSNLNRANLSKANLKGACFLEANLKKADLKHANLQEADLSKANLTEVHLYEVNFKKADLGEANFKKAKLTGVDLSEANLLFAKNLEIAQLSRVKTLYEAKLDSTLMESILQNSPQLVEKPKTMS